MHVLVVYGDRQSPECEISRVTGKALAEGAAANGHRVTEIDAMSIDGGLIRAIENAHRHDPIGLIVNGFHGGRGEDGSLSKLLDVLGIPYTHSGYTASSMGMDKVRFKQSMWRALTETGTDFPRLTLSLTYTLEQVRTELEADPSSVFVAKPNSGGSSLGLQKVASLSDLDKLMGVSDLMFERYVPGLEFTCGVIGTGANAVALPPTVILKSNPDELLDYRNKYLDSQVHYVTPATECGLVSLGLQSELQRIAYFAHTHFQFRSMSRCDFIVDNVGNIHLLEINSNPGFTPKSFVPLQAAAKGLDFNRLVSYILEDARIYWTNRQCA